jgi:hypothetical protein
MGSRVRVPPRSPHKIKYLRPENALLDCGAFLFVHTPCTRGEVVNDRAPRHRDFRPAGADDLGRNCCHRQRPIQLKHPSKSPAPLDADGDDDCHRAPRYHDHHGRRPIRWACPACRMGRRRRLAVGPDRLSICHMGRPSSAVLPACRKHFSASYTEMGGLPDAARGSVAAVSSMIELIAMAIGAASVFIFLTHAIDAYRA